MRRRDPLPDPEVLHGLRELDAALADEPGADPDLAVLVADVRAARDEPDPAFLASLDARVHAGFPTEAGTPRRRSRRAPWARARLLAPALGLAAAAGVAVVVVLGGGAPGDRASLPSTPSSADGGASSGASSTAKPAITAEKAAPSAQSDRAGSVTSGAGSAAPAVGGTPPLAAPVAPSSPSAPSTAPRKVERAAELTLTPKPADVQDVADGVVRETQAAGGYVQRSQVSTGDNAGSATFTLRVPSARLDDALARLSRLAHVGSLTQGAADITGSFTSATDRLSDARAERRALLRALGRATTAGQIAALRSRLRINRSEIAARKGDLAALRRRADLATVSVDVEGTAAGRSGGGAWTPADALDDALKILGVAGSIAVVTLAVLVPVALLAALLALAGRRLRRRRREGALDAA